MSESKWWKDQRVMGIVKGPGTVCRVRDTNSTNYPVYVEFDTNHFVYYTMDGKQYVGDPYPSIYPIDTVRPQPKVKRRIEGWVNVYEHVTGGLIHESEKEADSKQLDDRLGPALHIVHEWEE